MRDHPSFEAIQWEVSDAVGVLTLNRPACGNAITPEMAAEVREALASSEWDEPLRAVLIRGSGADFCVGVDAASDRMLDSDHDRLRFFTVAAAVADLTCPVVSAVHGNVLGAGLELALAADIRLCARGTRFAMPQAVDGRFPCDGGTQRLPRLIGAALAMEMLLCGRELDDAAARRAGLVNHVVETGELQAVAGRFVHRIASQAPLSLQYAKEAVLKGLDQTLEQGLRLEADLYFLLHTTRDRHEGIEAFRHKRPPRFTGS